MVRFITYDMLLNKVIGIDRDIRSAIDNIKDICNEKENICVTHDINDGFNENNPMNNKNGLFNRYYIMPVQKENNIKVRFK